VSTGIIRDIYALLLLVPMSTELHETVRLFAENIFFFEGIDVSLIFKTLTTSFEHELC